jgi:hypothetical protein
MGRLFQPGWSGRGAACYTGSARSARAEKIMRKIGLAIAVVVVLGGAAFFATYYFLSGGPQNDLKRQLDQALQKLPPGLTGAYKSLDVSVVSRGATLKGFELHGTGDDKFDLTVDELDLNGLALEAIPVLASLGDPKARAEDGKQPLDKETALADSIVVKGTKLHSDAADMEIAFFQTDKPRLFLGALLHPGVLSYPEVMKLALHPQPQPSLEEMLPMLRFEGAALLGVAYDGTTMSDMTMRVKMPPSPGLPPGGEMFYTIKKISGTGIGHGKIGSVIGEGVAVKTTTVPAMDMTLDHLTMAGLDGHDAAVRLLDATALDPSLADGLTLGKVEYAGWKIQIPGQAPVVLSSAGVSDLAFAHGMMTSGQFDLVGLKVNKALVANNAEAAQMFDQIGLDTATVSFGAGYKWDVEKKAAVLKQASFKVDELGALTLTADLSGIEKPDTLMTTATLNHAVLRYDDASFTGRAFKVAAAQNGVDPAAFSKQAITMVQMQAALMGANSPAIKAAATAVASFLTDPHNLTIELAPPQPMGMTALYAVKDLPPPQIFAQLGVKVTANQPAK